MTIKEMIDKLEDLPTRTEAIERMAVAMCQKRNRTNKCENCISASNGDCDLKSFYPLAESALDALIKGE